MRRKSALVLAVVVVLLPMVAIADEEAGEFELKFKGEGLFGMYPDGDLLVFFPYPGPDSLNVSHLGLSQVDWEIRVTQAFEFVDGWFTILGANGRDSLEGDYSGFVLDLATGEYDLEWDFTGGTGRFEGATGTGHTDGLSNLLTGEAKFEFSGDVTVPKEKTLIARAAALKATNTAVTGTRFVIPSGQTPTREWTDEDGVWHVRGSVAFVDFEGDLVGPGIAVVNLNLDRATGNGDESGYLTAELTWGELSGTFAGRFSLTYTGWVGVGHGVYHGTGGFAGMKFMEDFVIDFTATPVPPYAVDFDGIILDPHGK